MPKKEAPPKPEELIQKLGARVDTLKVELEENIEQRKQEVVFVCIHAIMRVLPQVVSLSEEVREGNGEAEKKLNNLAETLKKKEIEAEEKLREQEEKHQQEMCTVQKELRTWTEVTQTENHSSYFPTGFTRRVEIRAGAKDGTTTTDCDK